MRRSLTVAAVAAANDMTEAELRRLAGGGDESDLWRLFALLSQLGPVTLVGVEGDPVRRLRTS